MLYPLSYGSWAGWNQPVGLHKLLMARTTRTHRQPAATGDACVAGPRWVWLDFAGGSSATPPK